MFSDMFIHTKSDSAFLEFAFQTVMQMQKGRDGFKVIFRTGRLAGSDRLPRKTAPVEFQPGEGGMGSSERRKEQIKGFSFIFTAETLMCLGCWVCFARWL